MKAAERRMQTRIDDQKHLIQRSLAQQRLPQIEDFYWYGWHLPKPTVWGISATPGRGRSLLSQLLLTPVLIVDILPLSDKKFIETYGVDPSQMLELAREGHVVPNFYHYRQEAWREYAAYPTVANLLTEYGRPNTEWITNYLERRYGFSSVESQAVEFFRSIEVSEPEQQRLFEAAHGRVHPWNRFAFVYGQRLAYIQVLGGETFSDVVAWIREAYQTPELRVKAIRVLNTSKHLVATETTAAFGGYATYVPHNLIDIADSMRIVEQLTPSRKLPNRSSPKTIPKASHTFAEELMNRAHNLRLPSLSPGPHSQPALLTKPQFKKFKQVLGSVRDGRLGRLIDGMTEQLQHPSQNLEPTIEEYRALAAELDSHLRPLAPLASFLARTGSFLIKVDEMAPPGDTPTGWMFWLGNGFKVLGGFLDQAEIRPLFVHGRQRRLCGDWRSVRRALELTRPSQAVTKPNAPV